MNTANLYSQDFYAWTQTQAKALAEQNLADLDWPHLKEELEALGRQEYRELVSRLTVLLGHLLKWQFQPEKRSRSWFLTIREQRRAITRHLNHNPSLTSRLPEAITDGYEAGVDLALRETDLPLRYFPIDCPYAMEAVLDHSFLCNTDQDWEDHK